MISFNIPEEKKIRVILDTDVKNEVDDQFAIVHAVLTESFDIRGIIPAHFGDSKSITSQKDSYDEAVRVLEKMNRINDVTLYNGAEKALENEETAIDSPGARLIINEAMRNDRRPLYIAFLGPLTDMAAALLIEPRIAEKDITVIWIGGGDYPDGGWEYNLKNDVIAANVVFKSNVKLWQIPRKVYRMMPVSFAELQDRVYPFGEIGKYLTDNVVEFNNAQASRPTEYRILGDSPSVGVMIFADCGEWEEISAPEISSEMEYVHNCGHRPIRVYKSINSRFILEDFYSKLKLAYKQD